MFAPCAYAQSAPPKISNTESRNPAVGRARLRPPLSTWTFGNGGNGWVTLLGGSLAIEAFQVVTLEGTFAFDLWSIEGPSHDIALRTGAVPRLGDSRDGTGAGWVVQIPVLVGYHYIDRFGAPDGCPGHEKTHGFAAYTGVEVTRWSSPRFAWSVRLLGGPTFPFSQTRTGCWADYTYFNPGYDLHYAVEVGLDMGVAFQ